MAVTIVCHLESCPAYKNREKPMTVCDETESAWVFECRTCLNKRGISKHLPHIGGTIGQGRSDSPYASTRKWNIKSSER